MLSWRDPISFNSYSTIARASALASPFTSARESILTVFDPIFNPEILGSRSQPVDAAFIQLHSITFTHIEFEKFDTSLDEFLTLLDKQISKQAKWKVQGFYMAVCNITALFQYGSRESLLRKAYREGRKADDEMEDAPAATDATENAPTAEQEKSEDAAAADQDVIQGISLNVSKRLGYSILELSLQRTDDSNVLPHLHAWMIFLWHITGSTPAMQLLEKDFPWERLVDMLNELRAKFDKMPGRDAEATIHRETLAEDVTLSVDWTGSRDISPRDGSLTPASMPRRETRAPIHDWDSDGTHLVAYWTHLRTPPCETQKGGHGVHEGVYNACRR